MYPPYPSSTARDPLALGIAEDELGTWYVRLELDAWGRHADGFAVLPGPGLSTDLAVSHAIRSGGEPRVVYDLGRRDAAAAAVDLAGS
jgi:hypothetical protein